MLEEIVPKNATIVRTVEGFTEDIPQVGDIIKTIVQSNDGSAFYKDFNSIRKGNWRYATAVEMYCFEKYKIKNISQIAQSDEEEFKNYLNNKKNGDSKKDLLRIENAKPNGTRPRAVGIRKPTKQVTVTSGFIGNETKGKYLKKRIATIIVKTEPIKC